MFLVQFWHWSFCVDAMAVSAAANGPVHAVCKPSDKACRSPQVDERKGDDSCKSDRAGLGTGLASLTLWKTIVGTGIVAMARAADETGWMLFALLLLLVGSASHTGCFLLAKSLDIVGREDMDIADLGQRACGAAGWWMAVSFLVLDSWGAAVGYYKVIAGIIQRLVVTLFDVGDISETQQEQMIIFALACAIYPLTLYKKITDMGWISVLSSASLLAFVVVLVANACLHGQSLEAEPLVVTGPQMLLALPVIAFAFDCQVNVLPLYRELDAPVGCRAAALAKASFIANLGASASYYVAGMCGFAVFLGDANSNILINLPNSVAIFACVKVAYVVSIILTFPLLIFECASVLMHRVLGIDSFRGLALVQFIVIGSAAVAAAFLDSVYAAFAYVGATTAISYMAVLPPLFFIGVSHREFGVNPLSGRPTSLQDTKVESLLTTSGCRSAPAVWELRLSLAYLAVGLVAVPFFVLLTWSQS
eukprot:TRINITY_DN45363_c0_g1_i1.p1 TRINITY_DN45363_c0_g1~~TRINITY_DN45363_c0_g1_i1.p1  ORF type:complete len:478 (+),score=52.54 TRINITY_DN45363_c0_g1_i1:2-1435(+)